MTSPPPERRPKARLFSRSTWPEARHLADVLRTETVGGALLLLGAVSALIWANSPWSDSYTRLGGWVPWPGGAPWHLDLDLASWAADGLLAIFFFVVGLELKREFVAGELRDPRRAALPVVAALGGMLLPALIYVAVVVTAGGAGLRGWAIPTATDIAFALAVLALVSSHLPQGLRAFLLTLAVVDDLFAITIIAVFYTADFRPVALLAALAPIGLFALLVQRGRTWWWALIPLAATAWALVHASGVHATVAGVLLGFTVPVLARRPAGAAGGTRSDEGGLAAHLEHRWRPVSAGIAVPIFALFAAGVTLRGTDLGALLTDPVVIAIVAGLVLGKSIGIFGSTYLLARFTRAELDEDITWSDLRGIALLAGVGFTVSLLIGDLAFGTGSTTDDRVKVAVLLGSVISAGLAAAVLVRRNATYREVAERERLDADGDGVPDVYQRPAER
ncbi:Na+/H+ antiporter NhaA [Micromonospora parathelypteridis]|uniref:Na(+)/H(+) antiporter NhaA n=1 Tax=Micromonospora parathelypteridis TaxID=1839617 RepID=A0A840VY63_9ACTN|nr:Na+/H+ antiporter NhaA [Micromonospora parathelypteridis]MBB5481695.1 NhaA family Na+:H+ antiporter [Micromonospora parathelypteridis]GGO28611.1 Na(+)/H(+) antiporter NhaA [Micromonospora parathelypteridis]